jgi:Proprotein convertase P-domain
VREFPAMHGGKSGTRLTSMVLALALAAGLTVLGPTAAGAKKSKTFERSVAPNAPIPDESPANAPSVPVRSVITVGKKFKGKVIGDLNVLGITTTGSGANALDELQFKLTGPTGRTVYLVSNNNTGLPGQNLGGLSIDDDVSTSVCKSMTPCALPNQSLHSPFAGTVNLLGLGALSTGPLAAFNDLRMRGDWTLTVWDNDDPTTSILNGWGLRIKPAKPAKEPA